MKLYDFVNNQSEIAADSADIYLIKYLNVNHCTTNPSLILKSAYMPEYSDLLISSIRWGKKNLNLEKDVRSLGNRLSFLFGIELSKILPGFVFTEVDPFLSFDCEKTKAAARQIIHWYEELGCSRSRVQIKIAATWPGIKAAAELEKEGIQCTMTLLFSFVQAVACAEARVSMIAPYVARVTEWYKAKSDFCNGDPGVEYVKKIYRYYKTYNYKTKIIAASFRNIKQIESLYGCDYLTIPIDILKENKFNDMDNSMSWDENQILESPKLSITEENFHWMMSQNAMATEKLAEGLRSFSNDFLQLNQFIKDQAVV